MLHKLQRIQNHAARIVMKKKKHDHVTPLFWALHWLPVEQRIVYKIAIVCFKYFNDTTPSYLSNLIHIYAPPRSLRSSNQLLRNVPKKGSKKYADRAFSHAAPAVWNSLPLGIRNKVSCSESTFKKHLKTYLMNNSVTIM